MYIRAALRCLIPLAVAALAVLVFGCTTCQTCRADDKAPPPPAAPGKVSDSFATPADDEPADEAETPPIPAPVAPKAKKPRVRLTKTREVDGQAIVIEQNAPGTIVFGDATNPANPVPQQLPAPSSFPAPAALAAPAVMAAAPAYPLIPGPVPDSLIYAAAKRIGGGLYYAVTGKCPPPKLAAVQPTTFATAPASAVIPVTHMVPVQHVVTSYQPVTSYAAVPMAAPVQPASYVPQQAPQPQAAPQPPAAPTPQASPQAPRKRSLFGH